MNPPSDWPQLTSSQKARGVIIRRLSTWPALSRRSLSPVIRISAPAAMADARTMSSSGSRTSTGGSGSGTGPTGRQRRSRNRCVGRSSPLAGAKGGPRPARGLRCPEPGRDHPRACASDLEDFRPWCGGRAGSGFRPGRPPVAHASGARAEAFSPVPLGGSALGGCFKWWVRQTTATGRPAPHAGCR